MLKPRIPGDPWGDQRHGHGSPMARSLSTYERPHGWATLQQELLTNIWMNRGSQRCELLPSGYRWGNRHWETEDLCMGGKWETWDSNPAILPHQNTETLVKEKATPCSELFLPFAFFATLGSFSSMKLNCGFQLNLNLKGLLLGPSPPKNQAGQQEEALLPLLWLCALAAQIRAALTEGAARR